MQSAPAHRVGQRNINADYSTQIPYYQRNFRNEKDNNNSFPFYSLYPQNNIAPVPDQSYIANLTQIPRWDESFLNSTTPMYLNQSHIPGQGIRIPTYGGGVQTNGPHSYNINFHLNTAAPPDRRINLINQQNNDYDQVASFFSTQERNFTQDGNATIGPAIGRPS